MVSIVRLANGSSSLEFEPEEAEQIVNVLRETYGRPEVTKHIVTSEYAFPQATLIHYYEWESNASSPAPLKASRCWSI